MPSPKVLTSVNRSVVFFNTRGALVGRPSTPTVALPTIELFSATTPIEGNNAVFTVRLSKPWSENITFSYATSNGAGTATADALAGTDYTSTSGTGTVTATQSTTTVSVPTILRTGDNGNREFTLTISNAATASAAPVTITTATMRGVIADSTIPTGANGYFDALVAGPYHHVSYSLRDVVAGDGLGQTQINQYSKPTGNNLDVTYAPATDTDAQKQNAAKIVLACWPRNTDTMLASNIDASTLTIPLARASDGSTTSVTTAFNAKNSQIRIGSEVVISAANNPFEPTTGVLTVQARGAYGTTAATHTAGDRVYRAGNSLRTNVITPVVSADGSSWLITWDFYFTNSFLNNGIGNFKTFQIMSDNDIWLECQTHFDGGGDPDFIPGTHVAGAFIRSYNQPGGMDDYTLNPPPASVGNVKHLKKRWLGPEHTNSNPITGRMNYFRIYPGRWTRWWVRVTQRANNYDLMDAWLADEVQNPVQIYANARISVRARFTGTEWTGADTINSFQWEFNTSSNFLPAGRTTDFRDLVCYSKNLAVLRDPPTDLTSLLLKPEADT